MSLKTAIAIFLKKHIEMIVLFNKTKEDESFVWYGKENKNIYKHLSGKTFLFCKVQSRRKNLPKHFKIFCFEGKKSCKVQVLAAVLYEWCSIYMFFSSLLCEC